MKLLIDIGNTRIKWLWIDKEDCYSSDSFLVYKDLTIHSVVSNILSSNRKPEYIFCASVASESFTLGLLGELKKISLAKTLRLQSRKHFMGLLNSYAVPENLGVDRWLAMLSAFNANSGKGIVIASLGSAVTLDKVSADGIHKGGYILPGLSMSLESLSLCQNLDSDRWFNAGRLELAINTEDAITNGITALYLAFLNQQASQFEFNSKLILTGGDAEKIQGLLTPKWLYQPGLVIKGIALIANQPSCWQHFTEI